MHDNPIPPDFNRNGPDGQLYDPVLGARIGEMPEVSEWDRDADGMAMRINDPANPYRPHPHMTDGPHPSHDSVESDRSSVKKRRARRRRAAILLLLHDDD